jgi:hypothetical protein
MSRSSLITRLASDAQIRVAISASKQPSNGQLVMRSKRRIEQLFMVRRPFRTAWRLEVMLVFRFASLERIAQPSRQIARPYRWLALRVQAKSQRICV